MPRDTSAELTPEEVSAARDIFEGRDEQGRSGCVFCTGIHDTVRGVPVWRQPCPRVKRAVWHQDGTLLEVEYWPRHEWVDDDAAPGDRRHIIFPRDVYSVDDIEDGA
jgi:hypothetical protein